jgi:hypothetical protein
MKVSSREEELLSVGRELLRNTRRRGPVARAKSGIDDQDCPAADNDPDVGPAHNGPDMFGNFGCLLTKDRLILPAGEKMGSQCQHKQLGVHNRSCITKNATRSNRERVIRKLLFPVTGGTLTIDGWSVEAHRKYVDTGWLSGSRRSPYYGVPKQ